MLKNFKHIHIGKLIELRMQECDISIVRASKFLSVSEDDIEQMYSFQSLDSDVLLRWSKLLKYDFFRIYSQHLILYSPQHTPKKEIAERKEKARLPVLKKNIYTQEIVNYLVELVQTDKMTCRQLQDRYNIPATTIFRLINKAQKQNQLTE